MALLWNGTSLAGWGGTEYGGTFDGSPPLSQRLSEAASFGSYVPPAGCSVMQRIIVAPGDNYGGSTGWRNMSRQYTDANFSQGVKNSGYDSWHTFAILTPAGYPADANMFVAPWEVHQTDPGGGTGVAPGHVIMNASGLRVQIWGGSTNQAGGIGNPGHVVTLDQTYPVTQRDVWHVCTMRWKHGVQGVFELKHGIPGVSSLTSLTGVVNGATMYGTLTNYLLFGIYRNTSGSSTTTIYTAGWREYSTQAEAENWTATMLGSGGSPPPPPPPPPATTAIFVGPWTTGSFVNSRTGGTIPSFSFFGRWTTGVRVRSYTPAPSSAYLGNWTLASHVHPSDVVPPPPPAQPTITSFSPASGLVGTQVTINGTHLTGAYSVAFPGPTFVFTPGITVNPSGTVLTANVPAGASGTNNLNVATAAGIVVSPAQFTVTGVPAPIVTNLSPTSGGVGTPVTITGTDLGGATQVAFPSVTATTGIVVSGGGTSLMVSVPSGAAGVGTVTVTTPSGTSPASAQTFTVTGVPAPAAPTITSFSPSGGAVGDLVTITGANLTGATAVRFPPGIAATASIVVDGAGTSLTVIVPAGVSGSGTLTVTTATGGVSAASTQTFTVTVTAPPPPPPPPPEVATVELELTPLRAAGVGSTVVTTLFPANGLFPSNSLFPGTTTTTTGGIGTLILTPVVET